tara:strand:+ start:1134 stop:1481 length:348 start_codon:yes stop_codon:yes gene_type:complete
MNEVYRYLTKLTIYAMVGLFVFAALVALMGTAKAGEMEDALLSLEKDIDICIESKSQKICSEGTWMDDYMIKIMGNQDYMKKMATKCTIGSQCYSIMARLVTKISKATSISMGLN